jgi:hypothetical protein
MISYLDMAFCSSEKCVNYKCRRKFTDEHAKAAKKWWGGDDYPIAYADFEVDCKHKLTKED